MLSTLCARSSDTNVEIQASRRAVWRTHREDALEAGREHVLVEPVRRVLMLFVQIERLRVAGDGIDELEVHRLRRTR